MEVEQDRGPDDGRRLVDLAVELASTGGRLPTHTVERVASLVSPDAGDAGGILKQTIGHPDFADGPLERL
jgi:hypothetical protein